MKIPDINDAANQLSKMASNVAKAVDTAAGQVADLAGKAPAKIDKAVTKSIEALYQGIDSTSDAVTRDIRAKGELFATGLQVLGDAGTKVGDAQLDVLAKFQEVFGNVLNDRLGQAGRLGEILIGKNPLLEKLDIFDFLAARKCGTIEQAPANNLKGILDRLRELIEGGKLFGDVPPPGGFNPQPFPFPLPFPQPKPGIPPFVPGLPGGALQGMIAQIRDLLAALVEAIKQRGTQPPGSTNPLPPITNPSPLPGAPGASDFREAVFGQVRSIDGKISDLRAQLVEAQKSGDTTKAQDIMFQLQDLMQQKQQLIQMLTDLMKSEHEMAMSIIRNLKV